MFGQGGGSGISTFNAGVSAGSGAQITAGGNGSLSVEGIGGPSSGDDNDGVSIFGSVLVSTAGGNLTVVGRAGALSAAAGVVVSVNSNIRAGGLGSVNVTGTGGGGLGSGIFIVGPAASISSSGGDTTVIGIEGSGATSYAVRVANDASISATLLGGNLTLVGNSMAFDSNTSAYASMTGTATLKPYTAGVPILLSSTAHTKGGPLTLSATEFSNLVAGTVRIGDSTSGNLTVTASLTGSSAVGFEFLSGGNITFTSGTVSVQGNLNLSPGPSGNIRPMSTVTDVSLGSGKTLSFNSGADIAYTVNGVTANTDYQPLKVVGQVNLTGVDLVLSGSHVALGNQSFTLVDNDSIDAVIGTFHGLPEGAFVTLNGRILQISYVGGTGNDVVLRTAAFQVASITPTATGFIAEFNAPLDASVLNLYDQDATFGSADAALFNTTQEAVRGSLVIDPGLQKVTFIKSGGPLDPGNYTVMLYSGNQSFRSAAGESLGTDFSFPMSVTASSIQNPTVTLSLPDIARGFGQAVNVHATASTGLPVQISTGVGVGSASFKLKYDPALLTITGVVAGADLNGAVLTYNNQTPGQLTVTVTSATGLISVAGERTLVSLLAEVPLTAPYAAKHLLDLTDVHIDNTGSTPVELPSKDDDGIHIAAYFGDANGSQGYNAPDATAVQRLIVGLDTGFAAYQLADPYLVADITGNGQVQSDDVTQIQRAIVGLSTPNIPPHPGLSPPATGGPDPIVSIPQNLSASVRDTISVPVELLVTEPTGIELAGADIAIAYDPTALELTDIGIGQLLIGFGMSVNITTPGLIRLSLSGSPLDLPYYASGVLATLQFNVLAGGGTTSSLNLLQSSASLQTALYDSAGRPLTLSPAPTDGEHDEVDGWISILGDDLPEATWELPAIDMSFDGDDDFTADLLEEFVALN